MSAEEIDAYIEALEEPKRGTLRALRRTILEAIPEAQQGIAYGMPAFRLGGKVVAGFAAFKNHLSYVPHSGSVIPELADELESYSSTPGSLHFPIDKPLDKRVVERLIEVRLRQIRAR